MIDFYENPPKTKKQIRDYLVSWLQPSQDTTPIKIKGEFFIQEKGFRRAFYSHGVFRNTSTNEYIWYVCQDNDFSWNGFGEKIYSSFESMLEDTIDNYYIQWKLD